MTPTMPVTYRQAPSVGSADLQRRLTETYRLILRAADRPDTETGEAQTYNDQQNLSAA